MQYGGSYIHNLQWLDKESGIDTHKYKNTIYVSGICIILHKSCALLLCKKYSKLDYGVIDDVAIGVFFKKYNIVAKQFGKIGINIPYNKSILIYRNRTNNRIKDGYRMKKIIDNLLMN